MIGLVSLIPGGFGSSDAFWIARLPFNQTLSTAALTAYRFIYYIAPWFTASMVILSWAARRSTTRLTLARRVIGALVGGAGVLIIISSATPALHARLITLERLVPLPLVEAGQMAAALAGLLLLALARGLARGYRAAFKATMAVMLLAGFGTLLKGLDWEETVTLGTIALAAWSQHKLFDRESGGDWLEWTDLGLGFAALLLFLTFGIFSHHLGTGVLSRWTATGYHLQGTRFLRSAASMLLAVSAATLYVMLRTPVHFEPPASDDIDRALAAHAEFGVGHHPADGGGRRQVRVLGRGARLLPLSHHRSLHRRSSPIRWSARRDNGRPSSMRCSRSRPGSIAVRSSIRSLPTGFRCCTIAGITSSSSGRKRSCRSIA